VAILILILLLLVMTRVLLPKVNIFL